MRTKVAPAELIRKDFEFLREREQLATSREIADLLFIQSLEGRAHNGAGFFRKRYYVNTTIDDIVRALGFPAHEVKLRRQALIDDIVWYAKAAIQGAAPERLVDRHGMPLVGVPFLMERTVDPQQVLRGLYIGGLRDNPETRKVAEERFRVTIGYGRCYLLNLQVMERLELDGETLAHQEHEQEIETFRREGLIVSPDAATRFRDEELQYMYIRHKLGPGHSDDGAMIVAGLMYHLDVALGVWLSDAVDTLEKYVMEYRDQDDELADMIAQEWKGLDVPLEEVYALTYLAAIPEGQEDYQPDSSLRYFLAMQEETKECALQAHLKFIEGKPVQPMLISYNRALNTEFYRYLTRKFNQLKAPHLIEAQLSVDRLGRPISEVMRADVVVLDPGVPLKAALERLRLKRATYVVIQDERHNILGVLAPEDLAFYLKMLGD